MQKRDKPSAQTPKPEKSMRGKTIMGMKPTVESLQTGVQERARHSNGHSISKTKQDQLDLIEPLGIGGMGTVWKAVHKISNERGEVVYKRDVAVKLINFDAQVSGSDPEARKKKVDEMKDKFYTEVGVISQLRHRNIVDIVGFGEDEGVPYYVMELLHGEDLEEIIEREKPLLWQEVRPIMMEVSSALFVAHANNIVHRDIKPANIYIARGNELDEEHKAVKVLDFGLARIVDSDRSRKQEEVEGTIEYMAPEQAMGGEVDSRVDIYAVGAIMYEMLTGGVPFNFTLEKGPDDFDSHEEYAKYFNAEWTKFAFKINREEPKPLTSYGGLHIPAEAARIVHKCLARKPEDRYQSAKDLKIDLRKCDVEQTFEENLPSIMIRPSVQLPIPSENDENGLKELGIDPEMAEKTMVVRQRKGGDSLSFAETLVNQPAPKKRNKLRWAVLGTVGATAILTGAAIFGSRILESDPQQHTERQPVIEVIDNPAESVEPELVLPPPTADAEAEPDAAAIVNHTIRVRTNVDGVDVKLGDETLCTSERRECSFTLEESDESVTLTFSKRGFRDQTQEITPGSDQTLQIRMQPVRVRPTRPRNDDPFRLPGER